MSQTEESKIVQALNILRYSLIGVRIYKNANGF